MFQIQRLQDPGWQGFRLPTVHTRGSVKVPVLGWETWPKAWLCSDLSEVLGQSRPQVCPAP